ncbi:serine-rich coiled-coil domain-containing protein 2 [Polymixia lowei]
MEEKAPVRSAMVSRLPKFGARPSTGGTSPLPNGSLQPTTPPQEGKTTPPGARHNGLVRNSSFSLKWRRDGGSAPANPTGPEDGPCEDKAPSHLPSLGKEVKNAAPATPKVRRSGCSLVSVSSPKAIPKQASKTSPKAGTRLAQSPLHGGPKAAQNGSSAPGRPGSGSESRLIQPRVNSSCLRSSSQDSLSGDRMALDIMVRSHSFTHFKQIPSPTSQPMTRSFSFNRAMELAKPLANTQLRPPRNSFLKPPQLSNGRVGPGVGGLGGNLGGMGGLGGWNGGLQYSRASSAASSLPSPSTTTTTTPTTTTTTPSGLKKPLLPSCVLTKPSGSSGASLGFRLARPAQAKQQKPLFTGRVKGDVRSAAAPGCGGMSAIAVEMESTGETEKADSHSDSDRSSIGGGGGGGGGLLRKMSGQAAAEALEDMSLSSASSLERGDTSEEFLDDFDSLGDAHSDGDQTDNRKTGSVTQSRLRSFLDETMDWAGTGLAGRKEVAAQGSRGLLALSPEEGDLLQGSSLEISPSNSSGGTYMWDEEGLEPLGGPGTHPCLSYDDSELNSIDILNNLEPLSTGELEDDDLMLDLDLSEDGSLHHGAEGMAHIDRSERAGRQGHWRRKQQRWNGQDHFHNDNRSVRLKRRAPVFQHYDALRGPGSFRAPPRPLMSVGREDSHTGALDELTLKHMAQDCSSLKNQLLRLKTLLQLEDAGSPADVVEEREDNTTALQLEELMKEVRVLREELRSRDKTIAQLTLQCQQLQRHQQEQTPIQGRQGRCQCHHQRAPSALRQGDRQGDRRVPQHYDKATQTHWRAHSQAGVLPAPLLSPWQAPQHGPPRTSMLQRRQTSNTTAFQPLPQRALPPGKTSKNSPHRGDRGAHIDADSVSGAPTADASGSAGPLAPDLDRLSLLLSTQLHLLDHLGSGAQQGGTASDSPPSASHSGTVPERRASAEALQCSGAPRTVGAACPRMLQPPRLHRRVSVPALPPGNAGGSAPLKSGGSFGSLANHRTKQLPPPSRGLPCFNAGPRAQAPNLGHTSLPQPRAAGYSNAATPKPSPEEPGPAQLRDAGAAGVLIGSSHSRLPKPKIH